MPDTERCYHLLIVDDDAADRLLYCRLLPQPAQGRCQIHQAADGAAGLAAMRARPIDCVLLDFNLPDMTGLEFLADAAATGELPCSVVLVTGQGNEAIAVEAMKRGAQDYLVKDQMNANSLWRAITGAVTQTELRRHLAGSLRDLTAANAALQQEIVTRTAVETELRSARDIAQQAGQAKSRFVAMVTHELRTPLNGILGYAQLLRIEGGLSVRQDEHVGAMMQAGRHLLQMIERVLDFGSLETGHIDLHPVPVAVRDLAEGCIGFIGTMATEKGLGLRLIIAHNAPHYIIADPVRLRQVLLNLLGNAVKYTTTGSVELRVLGQPAHGSLRIEIADTGPGINAAAHDRLFQDFERLETASSAEGAGLGQAIAARIVGLMGGTIGHAANPGGGSVFWLELLGADVAPAREAVPAPAPSGRRILLVDDIAMNRDVMGAFLRAAGHEVVSSDNGQDAVDLVSGQAFDLILMDVQMPEMDGLEATRRIRALAAPNGRVPILALTAHAFRDQVEQCLRAGMDGHVAKPVDYETLMQVIEATILGVAPICPHVHFVPPPAGATAGGPADPVFDGPTFDRTAAFLTPDAATGHLLGLRARQQEMMGLLDGATDPAILIEAAHTLASAAGMFGFAALGVAARSFMQALERDAAAAQGPGQRLRAEIRAALVVVDQLVREGRMQSA